MPMTVWNAILLGLATFFVYDLALLRLTALYRRKRRKK